MARATRTTGRVLETQADIDRKAAEEAQKAAREANSRKINDAVADIVGAYVSVEKQIAIAKAAVTTAEDATRDKLRDTYILLAAFSHDNELTEEMVDAALQYAVAAHYGAKALEMPLSSASKLKSQLARAMHPKLRAQVPAIIKPWDDAWNAETKAIADERALAEKENRPVNPVSRLLRNKFDNRANTITQALTLAMGKDAKLNRAGDTVISPAEKSVTCDSPAEVLSWVTAHPRVRRGTKAATTTAANAVTAVDTSKTPRQQASDKIANLVAAVEAVKAEYPATDMFEPVLDALRKITGDRLVPLASGSTPPATPPAPPAPPAPAETVEGAAELDAAVDPAWEEYQAFQAFKRMQQRNS